MCSIKARSHTLLASLNEAHNGSLRSSKLRAKVGIQQHRTAKYDEPFVKGRNLHKSARYFHDLVRRYFTDAPDPAPSVSSINLLLGVLQCGGELAVNCFRSSIGVKSLLDHWDEDMPLRFVQSVSHLDKKN